MTRPEASGDPPGVIGVGVQTWGTDVAALQRYWRAADELGYARITYGDGLFRFTHDGFTMLGALASATRRARLGPAVTYCFDPSSHHPSWLAKRAVTVDHLSGGRLDLRLAVGAADRATAAAWRSHGIPYPDAPTRLALVAETIEILERLWTGEAVDHAERFYTLRGARLEPPPVQKPGPPIWLAAMGPAALDVAARCASGWEASYLTPAAFGARWATCGPCSRAPGARGGITAARSSSTPSSRSPHPTRTRRSGDSARLAASSRPTRF